MSQIVDQFDYCAENYAKFRPLYPESLFNWISNICDAHQLAIDCGTGNGQAARKLTNYFDQIIAIDKNPNQLKHAPTHFKIKYICSSVEKTNLPDHAADLIVSATAAQWFDLEKFYIECRRLLKPSAKLILWTYTWPEASHKKVQLTLLNYKTMLNPHWPIESLYHLNCYQTLPFPFKEIAQQIPQFSFQLNWNLNQLLEFFLTWATIRDYFKNTDPYFIEQMRTDLKRVWPDEIVRFNFPLYIKAGSV